ncbi:MAG: recombinase family protein [Gammaproteobacteria bacterium]|nr:recombinase family protein [Gammaproteobacteria bacterium]MBU1490680.1 recombinase family protein [Gammaproteobacteria bacterium]MBU2067288.1 recombinase family protein [Gammaproteobacteria bacterium]MBU2140099.1 recombinase family protein [Gammaproteobacteria bacterium]MBU2217724.1 recombinase family protein [Gammaproteobacteria bacterium]
MTVLAYVRVSTEDQSTEAQRHGIAQLHNVEHWFSDEATSGAIKALQRPGFAELFKFARKGDTLVVAAIDRLGRDTIDVLETVEALKAKGVTAISMREGFDLSSPVGKTMLTMLAAIAELERSNIKARQMAGIARARAQGQKLGAPKKIDDQAVATWRKANQATIQETATEFGISIAAVKRACAKKSLQIVEEE